MTEPTNKDETLFCFNCDTEAVATMNVDDNNNKELPICETCRQAYICGQGNPYRGTTFLNYDIPRGAL